MPRLGASSRAILRRDDKVFDECIERARADARLSAQHAAQARKLCCTLAAAQAARDIDDLRVATPHHAARAQWLDGTEVSAWYPQLAATMRDGPLVAGLRGLTSGCRVLPYWDFDFIVPSCVLPHSASTADPTTIFVPETHTPLLFEAADLVRTLQDIAVMYMRFVRAPAYGLMEVPPTHEVRQGGPLDPLSFATQSLTKP